MTDPVRNPVESAKSETQAKNAFQFVGFQLEDQHFAFRIECIQEIIDLDHVTRIPQVPEYVEGVSNLRGSIIPIINLHILFSLKPKSIGKETRTIVLNVGDRTIGCMVDQVSQVIKIHEDDIQPAPAAVTSNEIHYITGLAKHNDSLIILLDSDLLLDPEQLARVRHAVLQDADSL
ncbi:MAG: chemotaxis protein CheW [Planctomycetes bacterium]|nr:chemotaxis protein CheW [Planctomycetota bacterium]MCH9778705.1 chemotaxis protein CheW [Planctomycetota bacterium]MDF1744768.1 chemotaxis protein CheW [Gimesia sp.]